MSIVTGRGDMSRETPDMSEREIDRVVVSHVQTGFPVEAHPYATIADGLARDGFPLDEAAVCQSVQRLRDAGIIRRLGATFNPTRLGYVSTLVAVALDDPAHAEDLAARIDAYPEVTHDYLREEVALDGDDAPAISTGQTPDYTLWFTIIARDATRRDDILQRVADDRACTSLLNLPTTQRFKICVDFDLTRMRRETESDGATSTHSDGGDAPAADAGAPQGSANAPCLVELSEADKDLIRALEGDLDDSATPYAQLATMLGMKEEELIARIRTWQGQGIIRRLGATVRHRKMGIACNVMTVWDVPNEQVSRAGYILARFIEVSHCYARPRRETWPTDLYTMVHGDSITTCRASIVRMVETLGQHGIDIPTPRLLPSTREFKKRSMRYFCEDMATEGVQHR